MTPGRSLVHPLSAMKIPEILIVETVHQPVSLARVLQVIADAGLAIEHLTALRRDQGKTLWEITVDMRSEEHTSELQSQSNLVCRLLLEKKKKKKLYLLLSHTASPESRLFSCGLAWPILHSCAALLIIISVSRFKATYFYPISSSMMSHA